MVKDEARETRISWGVALLVAAGSLIVAIGFATPGSRMTALEQNVKDLQTKVSSHDTIIAVQSQKLDDLATGVNRLLGAQGLPPIPRRP